jgi:mRNA interferase RelE/StbE
VIELKNINFDKVAEKELKRIDPPTRRRIVDGIAGLLKKPPQGDIKQLKGNLGGLSRLRVGSWRIIYETTAETINILMISPRGGAYKNR